MGMGIPRGYSGPNDNRVVLQGKQTIAGINKDNKRMYPTLPPQSIQSIERISTDPLGRNGIIMVPLLNPLQSRLPIAHTQDFVPN